MRKKSNKLLIIKCSINQIVDAFALQVWNTYIPEETAINSIQLWFSEIRCSLKRLKLERGSAINNDLQFSQNQFAG